MKDKTASGFSKFPLGRQPQNPRQFHRFGRPQRTKKGSERSIPLESLDPDYERRYHPTKGYRYERA